ncbi:hypothetical protein Hdeb2414_s0006g00202551 [Helianthus debilis subsp. tardiflorus]
MSKKDLMKFMAKQMAKVIHDTISKIQPPVNTESSNASVDSKVETPKSTFTFKEFCFCNPLPFNGEEGATKMLQWFDAIKVTFFQSGCPDPPALG